MLQVVTCVVPLRYPQELILLQSPNDVSFPGLKLYFTSLASRRVLEELRCIEVVLAIND
jgi:hypothetical protein